MKELQQLLSDGLRYNPHYLPSGNSDHLPMTLCAMTGLGASLDNLHRYRAEYTEILHEITPQRAIVDWRTACGKGDAAYPAALAWCHAEIEATSVAHTVRALLPELIESLALRALHPLIRLGYALEFNSSAEVAAALAYWITCHCAVPISPANSLDLAESLQVQVANRPSKPKEAFASPIFGLRIREQIEDASYPQGRADSLQTCAAVSLDLYRSTRNFFALHLVTASQALRQCLPFVDEHKAIASLTGAILAAHRALDCPAFDPAQAMSAPTSIDREHGYKYAWVCVSEYRHYNDPRYIQELVGFRDAGLVPDWCAAEIA